MIKTHFQGKKCLNCLMNCHQFLWMHQFFPQEEIFLKHLFSSAFYFGYKFSKTSFSLSCLLLLGPRLPETPHQPIRYHKLTYWTCWIIIILQSSERLCCILTINKAQKIQLFIYTWRRDSCFKITDTISVGTHLEDLVQLGA